MEIHEFPEIDMSRIDMSRRVPNLGHENTRLQYLGRQKHDRGMGPMPHMPMFFLGAQTIPLGWLWDIIAPRSFQEHLWRILRLRLRLFNHPYFRSTIILPKNGICL